MDIRFVDPTKDERSRKRRSRENDKREQLKAELELLRGPKQSYGGVQRWNYVTGGQRGKTFD